MHVTPLDSSSCLALPLEKRAMATTSLSGASNRRAGALTGPCPPTNNTFWPCTTVRSEAEVEDRLVERRHVDGVQRREQLAVGETGEEAVDRPLEVGDMALEPLVQAH